MTDVSGALQSYDIFSPEAMADPIPLLHRIRAESPISWIPQLDAFLLTRHADIVAALKDRRLDTANLGRGLERLSPQEQDELLPLRGAVWPRGGGRALAAAAVDPAVDGPHRPGGPRPLPAAAEAVLHARHG